MEVKSYQSSIQEIYDLKIRINPKPQYQRTQVWKLDRKRLLLDSIFKGYDLPKFYLNETKGNTFFDFEVCDGQQRLRTIWEFIEDKFSLGKNLNFNEVKIDSKKYSELSLEVQQYLLSYKLTIALITEAQQSEIRDLFARLQKGMGLNQAELRRALSTHIGAYVESIVDNHRFFKNCGFPDLRNKHQDYIDHVIAFLVNDFNNDFKGQSLNDVYINVSAVQATQLIKYVASALDEMEKINSVLTGIFKNKWAFVDTFILIIQKLKDGKKIIHKEFVIKFIEFEKERKINSRNPSKLLEGTLITDKQKNLYNYIISFSKDGSLKSNVKMRNEVFNFNFNNSFK